MALRFRGLPEKEDKFWQKKIEKEDKRYEKVQRLIEKKDKKALEHWLDCWLGRKSREQCEEWL